MRWRTIVTDTESMTGVGPACPAQDDVALHSSGDGYGRSPDPHGVYACCPWPQIETWSELNAKGLMNLLNAVDAEPCS